MVVASKSRKPYPYHNMDLQNKSVFYEFTPKSYLSLLCLPPREQHLLKYLTVPLSCAQQRVQRCIAQFKAAEVL